MSSGPPRASSPPPDDPTTTWDRPLSVQFIHGLESSPTSSKAQYLDRFFDSVAPAMDTSDFEGAVRTQAAALRERPPDVLVGSSFGGAVALALLARGIYRGPTVLLAPAHRHYGVPETIPNGVSVVLVHGTRDDVVSIEGSRALARTGTPGLVELVEIDDEHRLGTILERDQLQRHVRTAFA
ncbi:MAG TPA: YqiA/YcfP family alpha/beta fold hydrolase, partial [Polyangiaceae bacterium]|nr:YqiA/YcfP family alpha/beta fold hydrolase [Polyangiaceae bacterium]